MQNRVAGWSSSNRIMSSPVHDRALPIIIGAASCHSIDHSLHCQLHQKVLFNYDTALAKLDSD